MNEFAFHCGDFISVASASTDRPTWKASQVELFESIINIISGLVVLSAYINIFL